MTEEHADVRAELERLRKLEQSLQAERERIRAAAEGEVRQLQSALRETAARAAQRERELQGLRAKLQDGRPAGPRLRRPRFRPDRDSTGAVGRVLATFERERQQLEERARAVAQTEVRQRKIQAELEAEVERLAQAGEGFEGQRRLSGELRAAEQRIAELEQQLRENEAARAAVEAERSPLRAEDGPEQELAARILAREHELARREEAVARREIELALVRRRIGEEERRLQERAWRTGAPERADPGPVVVRREGDLTFSEGWRLLARGRDGRRADEPSDRKGGNW